MTTLVRDSDPRPAGDCAAPDAGPGTRLATDRGRRHILTITFEDYFQVGAFHNLITRDQWYRFETRLVRNTEKTLQLLDKHGVKATFFVLGWNAERWPELVRQIADRGHEVASGGYDHRGLRGKDRSAFRDELAHAREAIEKASGRKVLGYRLPEGWLGPRDLWVLDLLAEEGYAYDSSLAPRGWAFRGEPWRRYLHQHATPHGPLWEVPPATFSLAGFQWPIAGGNYFRQLPHTLLKHAVAHWHKRTAAPFVMYFHVWELDPDQPQISAAGWLSRIRHYRNLTKMRWVLDDYLTRYSFGPIVESLKLDAPPAAPTPRRSGPHGTAVIPIIPLNQEVQHLPAPPEAPAAPRPPVTIVIPCYQEERSVPYLKNTLDSVERRLAIRYEPHFLFVDDGSRDDTAAALARVFGDRPNCKIIRHPHNRGVSAALRTGLAAAESEIVCSMDCDCTYDPHELDVMIPLLADGVDLVTASPYHPQGGVQNVPGWRLGLSRGASWMYRRVLGSKLHTYTSCFRVYRRSAVVDLPLQEDGFLGVAELLGELSLRGGRIVEHPATLNVRIFGQSKMKVLRTIGGHLRLLTRLARQRRVTGDG